MQSRGHVDVIRKVTLNVRTVYNIMKKRVLPFLRGRRSGFNKIERTKSPAFVSDSREGKKTRKRHFQFSS